MRTSCPRAALVGVLLLNHSCHAVGFGESKADALEARGEHDKVKRRLRSRLDDDADQDERMARIYPGHTVPLSDVSGGPGFLRSLLISLKIWRPKVPRTGWDSIIRTSSDIERLKRSWNGDEGFQMCEMILNNVLRYRSTMLVMSPITENQLMNELTSLSSYTAMVTVELLHLFPETMELAKKVELRLFEVYGRYDQETLRQKMTCPSHYDDNGNHVFAHYIRNFIQKFRGWQSKDQRPPLHTDP